MENIYLAAFCQYKFLKSSEEIFSVKFLILKSCSDCDMWKNFNFKNLLLQTQQR